MSTSKLSRLELSEEEKRRRKISVPQAAEIKGISPDTFRRNYKHLIKQLSPRRVGVALGDVLADE